MATSYVSLGTTRASYPFEKISWDIMPVTDKGNKCILVVSDVCISAWVEAFPLQVTDGLTLTNTLMDEVICHYVYGVPTQLHSDQGSNLNAEVNQNPASCLGFKVQLSLSPTHREMDKWNVLTTLCMEAMLGRTSQRLRHTFTEGFICIQNITP